MPLRGRKGNNYSYRSSWKSDNYRKRNEGKRQRNCASNESNNIKSNYFVRNNREKSNIAPAILKKKTIKNICILSAPIKSFIAKLQAQKLYVEQNRKAQYFYWYLE